MSQGSTKAGGEVRGTNDDLNTVDRRMASGAIWMVLARICDKSIGLVGMIILARLLAPQDFGLVAMAAAVVALVELVRSFGFDVALIQNQDATREHYDTAWTFNIILGVAIALGLLLVAHPAAVFFDEPRLEAVIQWLAVPAFVTGFDNVGTVLFRKELELHKEFKYLLLKRIAMFAITVPLAFVFRSYWALVAGTVAGKTIGVGLSYLLHPYRPSLCLAARRQLFGFGKWLIIGSTVNFFSQKSADFAIGKFAGAHALGVFGISYDLSTMISSQLTAPINRAVFPGYAKKSHDLALLRNSYLDVMGVMASLATPAAFGLAAVAPLAVPLVLGEQWMEAVPVVATLAFYGLLSSLKANGHYVYMALGRPKIATYLGITQLVVLLPMAIYGAWHSGATGAASGYLYAQILFTPVSLTVLFRALDMGLVQWLNVIYRPLIAALVMYFLVRAVHLQFGSEVTSSVDLAIALGACIVTGVVAYPLVMFALWQIAGRPQGAEKKILGYLVAYISPRLRRMSSVGR